MKPENEWLALCLRSESDYPHEWLPLAWVIRNRVEDRRRYPRTYQGVILQPWQFSYFNPWTTGGADYSPDWIYDQAREGYAGDSQGWADNDLEAAYVVAVEVLEAPRARAPFSHKVLHFWAPGAMGGDPSWASELDVFELSGNLRWKFGETR